MTKSVRRLPDKDIKILFSLSAGRCAFPGCRTECVIQETALDSHAVIGKIAHIYAHSDKGPRANDALGAKERDSYPNWILLCANHHDVIDKQQNTYTAETLFSWKADHEKWIKERLTEELPNIGFLELELVTKAILSGIVEPAENLHLITPKEKIKKNSLSAKIEQLIVMGMVKSKEVESFLKDISKTMPNFPEQMSNGFVAEYNRLREEGLVADELFDAMWVFSSGGSKEFLRQSAGLTVLVYLFQKCEVFEK